MRWHKILFLNLEKTQCYGLKFCSINRNCLFRTKARVKETDNQNKGALKFQDPLEGKEVDVGTSKYLPGTYFSL